MIEWIKPIRVLIKTIVILGTGEFLFFLLMYGFPESVGVLIGTGGALVNLFSLWYDINEMVKRKSTKGWLKGFLGRYSMSAFVLLVSGLISLTNLIGAFLGLMNLKIAAYVAGRWLD